MRAFRLTTIAILLLLPVYCGAAGADYREELDAARALFLEAVDGGKREVRRAQRRFRELRARFPDDPAIAAYLGACASLQARDAASGVNKQRYAEEATKRIDAALEMLARQAPGAAVALDTKLVAAHTFLHMPRFLNRFDDGAALVDELLGDARLEAMPAGFRAAVHLAAAKAAGRSGETGAYRRHLERAAELDPEGRNGRRAAAALAGAPL